MARIESGNPKNVKEAIRLMEEKYGEGTLMMLDDTKKVNIAAISTSSVSIDYATGIGGIPRGRIVEIYGPESSGKTTLCLHIIAEAQKQGIQCAIVDAEHALDTRYARDVIGVDTKCLLISQPDNGEQALDIVEMMVKTKEVGLIVVDSVAALTPLAEIEADMGSNHVGLMARMMSQALRKLTALAAKNDVTIIFINQIRMNIGQTWGNPETTTGGKALKFFTSMRIEIRRQATLKRGEEPIGNRVGVKIAKNKLAAPFKTAVFDILFTEGISKVGDLVNFALLHKVLDKEGNTISFKGEKIAVGLDKVKEAIKANKELTDKIFAEVRKIE